jgi:hypothetical protein
MERRDDRVPAVRVVRWAVSAALGDVDLSTHRPVSVDIVFWHRPNGRPEPIALRHFRDDFNLAVLDAPFTLCGHACAADRVDDIACSLVAIDGAHRNI